MRVLLDTDVVLDVILDRQPFVVEAGAIWLLHEQGDIVAYVTPVTPVNVFYIVRKLKDKTTARHAVEMIGRVLQICPVDQTVFQTALALPFTDVEDAVQAAAAAGATLDALITRNTVDYAGAPLPVLTPTRFLEQLRQTAPED
jgi:predicted nucleic acid-binding protein